MKLISIKFQTECHLRLFKDEEENLIINATIADQEFGNFTLRQPNDELLIEEKVRLLVWGFYYPFLSLSLVSKSIRKWSHVDGFFMLHFRVEGKKRKFLGRSVYNTY